MRPVLTKQDFTRRYAAGEFGNHAITWDYLADLLVSNYDGLVHLRNRVAGGETYYNMEVDTAITKWGLQIDWLQWYCSAMAPTANTIIQGEVMDGPWGLNLTWTTIRKPMREALQHLANFNTGLLAKHLLQRSMNDLSWQWLEYLLESYQDHVIEFSVYEHCWGTVPDHNTVFWEVRKY